ncbi:hypothetical protein ABGB18_44430 [Nonomuraea sp. B12E4]|uniref:hypothetical protein n=1 Tax=Nonomuraea sp. B12E4 TaxID=3153564 RepID=UPI00325F779F
MIAELVDRVLSGDDDAVWELGGEAEDDPVALRPYLRRLLDADMYLPETLFRAADEDLQREAVARLDAGAGEQWLITVLTATRGPVVEAAFRRWRSQPPPGIDVDLVRGLQRYGWDFDADGRALRVCGTTAYRLVPEEGASTAAGTCPWCQSRLWTLLDVDTADPAAGDALAHSGWQGRLRIVACCPCSTYADIFTEVTPEGGAAWSTHTVPPGYLNELVLEAMEPPPARFTPGERRPGLYLAGDGEGRSTLGGRPDWIQDPDYPVCPGCGQVMTYVGALAGADVAESGAGVHYLFLHAPCGLAGVVSQFD